MIAAPSPHESWGSWVTASLWNHGTTKDFVFPASRHRTRAYNGSAPEQHESRATGCRGFGIGRRQDE